MIEGEDSNRALMNAGTTGFVTVDNDQTLWLRFAIGTLNRDPGEGEGWQYMGSTHHKGTGDMWHQFRNRWVPSEDRRVYVAVQA